MSAGYTQFNFSTHCPYVSCGREMEHNAESYHRFCINCGLEVSTCPNCRANNRLFAAHCRACGRSVAADLYPMECGLKDRTISFRSISSIAETDHNSLIRFGAGVSSHLVAADGIIVACFTNGGIGLIGERGPGKRGHLALPEPILITPVLDRGFLYVVSGRRLFAFDLSGYLNNSSSPRIRPIWEAEINGASVIHPLLADSNTIYITTKFGEGNLIEAISMSDGTRLWAEPVRIFSEILSPVLVNGLLLVLSIEGEIFLIEPSSGLAVWNYRLGHRVASHLHPFVSGSRAVFVDSDSNIKEVVVGKGQALINLLFPHRARISSISVNEDFIIAGHSAGLTLLSGRGHPIWANSALESVSVAPIISGDTMFVLDDTGTGLLFNSLSSNPIQRVRLLSKEIQIPPIQTFSSLVAVNAQGDVSVVSWR